MATFDDVRRIAMALPEAEEILTWETDMTFRVHRKIFAIGAAGGDRASIKASVATQADLVYRDPRGVRARGVRRPLRLDQRRPRATRRR